MIRGLPFEEGVLGLRVLAMDWCPSRIGTVSCDSRISCAGGRAALMVETVASITDLTALTSLQFVGGLGFAAANWDELAVSSIAVV